MRNSMACAALFMTTALMACKVKSPAPTYSRWTGSVAKDFAMLDSNTVRLIKDDIITQDINANRRAPDVQSNKVTTYYFRINRDSSVTIMHGVQDDIGDPIIYKNMEESTKEDFGKAVEYANTQRPQLE